ncbi:hypothetical protein ARALYDRAFT_314007 [Arabidopsis lyrata subsp. lyrata]|uniref:Large ribosomal subunit protein uL4 C-terminal domain-containing protein n=1 Tax=Arabidopsis lyrata subsp. lyrata TaxID=81972 RepID=D7KL45_ARALL|nr:hypothetical protein ARALYDRAFT_314007 [Arabidopsis lyrata subsp. lyrata]
MCRGGRMFAPTKIWRRLHCRVNVNIKRHAMVSAIAATAVPSLVMARGHKIENVPEFPLVVGDSIESVEETSEAVNVLKRIVRSGKGKMRNRRYIFRKGPLIVYGTKGSLVEAFRNITGIDICNVERLSLLKLAPGGHLGRSLSLFTARLRSYQGYVLLRPKMLNADLARIINSDEDVKRGVIMKNPLKNLNVMVKLSHYAKTAKMMSLLAEAQREEAMKMGAAGKSCDYTEFDNFSKWLGLSQ